MVFAWLGMGLLFLHPRALRRGQQKQVGSGQVEQLFSSSGVFVAWKSTSLSFKIIIRMQMYKNDMLLIFVVLICYIFILM